MARVAWVALLAWTWLKWPIILDQADQRGDAGRSADFANESADASPRKPRKAAVRGARRCVAGNRRGLDLIQAATSCGNSRTTAKKAVSLHRLHGQDGLKSGAGSDLPLQPDATRCPSRMALVRRLPIKDACPMPAPFNLILCGLIFLLMSVFLKKDNKDKKRFAIFGAIVFFVGIIEMILYKK